MHFAQGPSSEGTDPSLGHPLSPAAVATWFGTPFASLAAPDSLGAFLGTESDHDAHGNHRKRVTVRYLLPGDEWIHVATQHLGSGAPLDLAWGVTVNYLLAVAGEALPWRGGPPPAEYERLFRADRDGGPEAVVRIQMDGAVADWPSFTELDVVSGRPYVSCGGLVGELVVAAVGPAATMPRLAVTTS
jgi:hypothetical protein